MSCAVLVPWLGELPDGSVGDPFYVGSMSCVPVSEQMRALLEDVVLALADLVASEVRTLAPILKTKPERLLQDQLNAAVGTVEGGGTDV